MQLACQIFVVMWLAIQLIANVVKDFSTAEKNGMYEGVCAFIGTCVVMVMVSLIMYGAGAFSELIK